MDLGAILPGISSGVFCVIFGIYEKLLDSVLNFTKDIKNNIKFLTPILIGCFLGYFIFGNILNYCLFEFPVQSKSIFIGLILGSIPSLIKDVNKKTHFKLSNLFFLLISIFIGILSIFLESFLEINTIENINYLYLFLCGFLMSIGIIVPGVSSTIILMILGVYSIYLNSISNFYLPTLIPIGFGVIIGSFFFMRLTKYLLDYHYSSTFYSIIGFTVGSIFILIPTFYSALDFLIGILCAILRFFDNIHFKKYVFISHLTWCSFCCIICA